MKSAKLLDFIITATLILVLFGCAQDARIESLSESPESAATTDAMPSTASDTATDHLTICSFNIQFLGHFKKKDDEALAAMLKDYDIVVIQELVAPPVAGTYPDDDTYTADADSAEFFDAMEEEGFSYKLSEEDTGTNDEIHKNGPATEWWVTFYKADSVEYVSDIPSGFLADDRSNHDDYERVPYAFAFRTPDEEVDFVLISVHLKPGASAANKARRQHELTAIADWIDDNDDVEKDFIILGDMNIENATELAAATPSGYLSLNDECHATNTNPKGPKPYDHVMYNTTFTTEIDSDFDLEVIDLIEAMEDSWTSTEDEYPGDPYVHNQFKQYYSDHHPVVFRIKVSGEDDDLPTVGESQYVATQNGTRFHRPTCRYVKDRQIYKTWPDRESAASELSPCGVCKP